MLSHIRVASRIMPGSPTRQYCYAKQSKFTRSLSSSKNLKKMQQLGRAAGFFFFLFKTATCIKFRLCAESALHVSQSGLSVRRHYCKWQASVSQAAHSTGTNQDVEEQQPMLNSQLCATVSFPGNNPTVSLRMLAFMGVQVVSERTFFALPTCPIGKVSKRDSD